MPGKEEEVVVLGDEEVSLAVDSEAEVAEAVVDSKGVVVVAEADSGAGEEEDIDERWNQNIVRLIPALMKLRYSLPTRETNKQAKK